MLQNIIYPVANPDVSGNEKKYLIEAIDTAELSWHGKFVTEFENKFAARHNAKFGIAVTSGTTALTLAVAALNCHEGDEIIVPEFTMVATAWAVTYNNAKCVFVDCDDNLLIDIDKIEEKITPRTKAIMPVHIFGRQVNITKIKEIAQKHNLKVIEDSALAHSFELQGDVACYAFFANKILQSGEGGICITNNEELTTRLRYLKNMAFDENHTFLHKELGFNFRMTNLQAAVLCAQLERLDEFIDKRKQIEGWYNEALKDIKQITIMPPRKVLWMYDLLAEDKDNLMAYLREQGIDTRHYFKPMSEQAMYLDPVYKTLKAKQFSLKGLYLPTYVGLTKEDVGYIASKINDFYSI